MRYLRIENTVAVLPSPELLWTLGASASRGIDTRIGQFGSGLPNTLALFARKSFNADKKSIYQYDLNFLEHSKFCLGTEHVFTFFLKDKHINDSMGNQMIMRELYAKKQGGGVTKLGISSEFGALDWDDMTMGLRELISNAIDGQDAHTGNPRDVKLEIVEENQNRADDGFIRFYVPLTREVEEYYDNYKEHFICLNASYNKNEMCWINHKDTSPIFYRKGVRVSRPGQFYKHSLFHYNIEAISLKESRHIDSSEAEKRAAYAILHNPRMIAHYIKNMNPEIWESSINAYYFKPDSWRWGADDVTEAKREQFSKNIALAWVDVHGMNTIACADETNAERVRSKGMRAVKVDKHIIDMIKNSGIKTSDDILSNDEKDGRTILPPTPEVLTSVDKCWARLVRYGMTNGKDKPPVVCFSQVTTDDSREWGRRTDQNIMINVDAHGTFLDETVLEEIAHWITDANDFTRPMQNFAFQLAARVMQY